MNAYVVSVWDQSEPGFAHEIVSAFGNVENAQRDAQSMFKWDAIVWDETGRRGIVPIACNDDESVTEIVVHEIATNDDVVRIHSRHDGRQTTWEFVGTTTLDEIDDDEYVTNQITTLTVRR